MPESTVITKQTTVKPAKNLWIFIFASPHYVTFIIAGCFCALYSFRLFLNVSLQNPVSNIFTVFTQKNYDALTADGTIFLLCDLFCKFAGKCAFLSGFTSHSDEIRSFPKFCTRCLAPYICILLTANLHGAAAFHSPFRHTCSNRTERIRLTLAQTCPRAAPSVTACAVPPSSGRKALVFRAIQTCLSLWERCRTATERAKTS